MKSINPCLWFDSQAEEAARFYTSVFKKSKIGPSRAMQRLQRRPPEGRRGR